MMIGFSLWFRVWNAFHERSLKKHINFFVKKHIIADQKLEQLSF